MSTSSDDIPIYEDYEVCSSICRMIHGTNIKHGEEIVWYPSEEAKPGTIKTKANYHQGVPHGNYEEYYPNGQTKVRVTFSMGNQITAAEYWDEQGNEVNRV